MSLPNVARTKKENIYDPSKAPKQTRLAREGRRKLQTFFMNEDLRQEIHKRNAIVMAQYPEGQLPNQVHRYHSLFPLDDPNRPHNSAQFFGNEISRLFFELVQLHFG